MITIDCIREKIANARDFAFENREFKRKALFDHLLDALRGLESKPLEKARLEANATALLQLRAGIAEYLRQSTKRNPDLVLDVLVEGANNRLERCVKAFGEGRACPFSDKIKADVAAAFRDALLVNYRPAVSMCEA